VAAPRKPATPVVAEGVGASDIDAVLLALGGPQSAFCDPATGVDTLVFYTRRIDAVEHWLKEEVRINGSIERRHVYVVPPGTDPGATWTNWIAYFETACDAPWVNCRITTKTVR
jgi:hypothetical protein